MDTQRPSAEEIVAEINRLDREAAELFRELLKSGHEVERDLRVRIRVKDLMSLTDDHQSDRESEAFHFCAREVAALVLPRSQSGRIESTVPVEWVKGLSKQLQREADRCKEAREDDPITETEPA